MKWERTGMLGTIRNQKNRQYLVPIDYLLHGSVDTPAGQEIWSKPQIPSPIAGIPLGKMARSSSSWIGRVFSSHDYLEHPWKDWAMRCLA